MSAAALILLACASDSSFRLFPAEAPDLRPSLAALNLLPTKASQPGALIPSEPLSSAADGAKEFLGSLGLSYDLKQALLLSVLGNRTQGDGVLGAYSAVLWANWNIFQTTELGESAGWLSTEFSWGSGLGIDWSRQSPQGNLGTASLPYYEWLGRDIAVSEVAWSQSFLRGELVVVLGMVDQTNYFDTNIYANNAFGQLMNGAFVESEVLPMPGQSLGLCVQWAPTEWLDVLLGVSTNNLSPGRSPWQEVSWRDMSYLLELGLSSEDVLGLGPGKARLQPFVATSGGRTGGGVALNLEQQLGRQGPLGVFARVGVGDDTTAAVNGARAGAAAGVAMLSPFTESGWFSKDNSDYVALGLKWTKVGGEKVPIHEDEYAVEVAAAIQITPTATIQPSFQYFWDPAFSPNSSATVFQLALNIVW